MNPQVIGIYVTIGIFIFTQIIGLVFAVVKFSSAMGALSTTVDRLNKDLERISKVLESFNSERYTKHDAEKDFAIRDSQHDKEHRAMWRQIDIANGKQPEKSGD